MSSCLKAEFSNAATNDGNIKILIVSDIRFLRESLAEALARESKLVISGCFADLEEALSVVAVTRSEIILLDEAFPEGLRAVRRIREAVPQVLPVVIAVTENPEFVIAWGEAGVAGYIPRSCGVADIFPLLADIRCGRQACSAEVAAGLLHRLAVLCSNVGEADGATRSPVLTVREMQIGHMIVAGMSNKDIARRLDIGVATAKTHVHHLLAKLNVQRRGQVVNWMSGHGRRLTPLSQVSKSASQQVSKSASSYVPGQG